MSAGANDAKKVFGLPYKQGVGVLCGLGALALYFFYSNVLAPDTPSAGRSSSASVSATAPPPTIPIPGSLPGAQTGPRRGSPTRGHTEEFRPVLHSKRPEDRIEPKDVDPTLRLDLLAKVQAVDAAGGTRNLFQMGVPPKAAELPKGPEPIVVIGPVAPPKKVEAAPPPPPPVTPIPLKFYGFSTVVGNAKKTAYFQDGDDILVACEGDTLKRRYRVVRIGPNSVLMEDTESKRQQSLPLTEETPS